MAAAKFLFANVGKLLTTLSKSKIVTLFFMVGTGEGGRVSDRFWGNRCFIKSQVEIHVITSDSRQDTQEQSVVT